MISILESALLVTSPNPFLTLPVLLFIMAAAKTVKAELKRVASPAKARVYQRFFKTGPGEYGEGDIFIGCMMPDCRAIAKQFQALSFKEIQILLNSKIHEERMVGLVILTYQYEELEKEEKKVKKKVKKNEYKKKEIKKNKEQLKEKDYFLKQKKKIYAFYMKNLVAVNNWDLVDVTVPRIVGAYLLEHPEEKKIIYKLVRSRNLWDRRVAVLATFPFIKAGDFTDILALAELLLGDRHDLIHKAVGWMLREVGKRGSAGDAALRCFLDRHAATMPRTMLRYAIERFPESRRKAYLKAGRKG